MYYKAKKASLEDIFGTHDIQIGEQWISVNGTTYPIIEDVIILQSHIPSARDIQFTFGREWERYPAILPEHKAEFEAYFDLVNLNKLETARICDMGCGNGRWSYFLKNRCRELVLVDFSDAIFVARKNLADTPHCLFFKGDLQCLPFRNDFCDFLFSLGVLHHLPTPCLEEIKKIKKYAPHLLLYLYYNLDNRPWHFRFLLWLATGIRTAVSRIRNTAFRRFFSITAAYCIYMPFIMLGSMMDMIQLGKNVPLYEAYKNKSMERIEQDAYDRFFTRIEQRVSHNDIMALKKEFTGILISPRAPYYHFLCIR